MDTVLQILGHHIWVDYGKLRLASSVTQYLCIVYISEIYCEVPVAPDNGQVYVMGDLSFWTLIVYSCDAGYSLQGEALQYCVGEGQWSGLPPTCQSQSYLLIITHTYKGHSIILLKSALKLTIHIQPLRDH